MPDLERWVKESEIRLLAEEAARSVRCTAHRCRLSIWGWGTVGLLFLYTLYLHSTQIKEREEWRGTFASKIEEQVKTTTLEVIHSTTTPSIAALSDQLDRGMRDIRQRYEQAERLLQRAERLQWALTTPDLERDQQLKEALDALKTK